MTQKQLISYIVIIFILIPVLTMGSAYINNFHARRDNDNRIILEWITESEINVARFIIKRNDQKIGSVPSKSSNSTTQQFYQFIDSNTELLKSSASSLNYSLTIVDVNGHSEDYPVIASISGNSGIRHTWGSLKALFR